jgi:hypothetical protein
MIDIFTRVWENLVARTEGPMFLRFILQPAMSVIFAIIAGIRDAKSNTVPYLWRLKISEGERKEIAKEAWKDVGKVFIIAVILDIVYQLVVIFSRETQHAFYPLESVIVAFGLAIIPYLFVRGPLNRVIRNWIKK